MGLITLYCEKCGNRVTSSEIEEGKAIRSQSHCYCVECSKGILAEEAAKRPKENGDKVIGSRHKGISKAKGSVSKSKKSPSIFPRVHHKTSKTRAFKKPLPKRRPMSKPEQTEKRKGYKERYPKKSPWLIIGIVVAIAVAIIILAVLFGGEKKPHKKRRIPKAEKEEESPPLILMHQMRQDYIMRL